MAHGTARRQHTRCLPQVAAHSSACHGCPVAPPKGPGSPLGPSTCPGPSAAGPFHTLRPFSRGIRPHVPTPSAVEPHAAERHIAQPTTHARDRGKSGGYAQSRNDAAAPLQTLCSQKRPDSCMSHRAQAREELGRSSSRPVSVTSSDISSKASRYGRLRAPSLRCNEVEDFTPTSES